MPERFEQHLGWQTFGEEILNLKQKRAAQDATPNVPITDATIIVARRAVTFAGERFTNGQPIPMALWLSARKENREALLANRFCVVEYAASPAPPPKEEGTQNVRTRLHR